MARTTPESVVRARNPGRAQASAGDEVLRDEARQDVSAVATARTAQPVGEWTSTAQSSTAEPDQHQARQDGHGNAHQPDEDEDPRDQGGGHAGVDQRSSRPAMAGVS